MEGRIIIKQILITGGAGFIGSNLANMLAMNNQVVVLDDLSMGKRSNLKEGASLKFIEGDVLDKALLLNLLSTYQFDYIFHLAAIASVADSVKRPIQTNQVNFYSLLQLLEILRNQQYSIERLIFASSAAVYGNEPSLPKSEISVIEPLSPYAIDKFAAEQYCLNYAKLYGIKTTAVRFFNVYGKNQNPDSAYSGVISLLMKCFLSDNDQNSHFKIYGDGEQSRDFIYVKDAIQALKKVAVSKDSIGEVYNVGTGIPCSLNHLISLLEEIFSQTLEIENTDARKGDIMHSYADITKLKTLGFSPKYSIETGLQDYFKEIKK